MNRAPLQNWPEWWHWDLELTSHLLKRMEDRTFSELDLRAMMETASTLSPDKEPGRWVVATRHEGRTWEIIVEPDAVDHLLVVVTAYPIDLP